MEPKKRQWYKKKRYIIPLAGAALLIALSGQNSPKTNVQSTQVTTPAVVQPLVQKETTATPVQKTTPTPATSGLSNDNYYTNVDGNKVHSPAYSSSIPAGATAQCRDGTYSFSQHRQGTCSHHGGVASWL